MTIRTRCALGADLRSLFVDAVVTVAADFAAHDWDRTAAILAAAVGAAELHPPVADFVTWRGDDLPLKASDLGAGGFKLFVEARHGAVHPLTHSVAAGRVFVSAPAAGVQCMSGAVEIVDAL